MTSFKEFMSVLSSKSDALEFEHLNLLLKSSQKRTFFVQLASKRILLPIRNTALYKKTSMETKAIKNYGKINRAQKLILIGYNKTMVCR